MRPSCIAARTLAESALRLAVLGLAITALIPASLVHAQTVNPSVFSGLRWRSIGPPRSGYVSAPAGIPGDPTTYYAGMPEGGVWKTTNGGLTWTPVFDDARVASVGAVAVAPSAPDIVYVGTGNQTGWAFTTGKGVYKSTDAGKTWSNIGLAASSYIGGIVVHPRNPNVLLVAALGPRAAVRAPGIAGGGPGAASLDPLPPGERGVYLSKDGGRTWTRVLPADGSAGASDVYMDVTDPQIVFALASVRAQARRAYQIDGRRRDMAAACGARIARRRAHRVVRRGLRDTRPQALRHGRYRGGVVAAGAALYRSDDGGETWTFGTRQLASAGGKMYADPQNPDVVYLMGTAIYRSTDARSARRGVLGRAERRRSALPVDRSHEFAGGCSRASTRARRSSVDGGESLTPYYGLAERPVLSRVHRLRLSVPRVRPAAGLGHGVRREPERLRHDPAERLVLGRRVRERVPDRRSSGPALSVHAGLVPRAAALRSHDRPGGRAVPAEAKTTASAALRRWRSRRRIARTLYMAAQHVLASDDRGQTWRDDQPRPGGSCRAAPRRRLRAAHAPAALARRPSAGRSSRSRSSPVTAGGHLGRHQHRPDSRHARRRQDLDERDAAESAAGRYQRHRRVARERRHRVRRSALARRAPAYLSHHGLRPALAGDLRRVWRRRGRARCPRRPDRPELCSTPGRSPASRCRSIAAITGSRCNSTCRPRS